ncbi:hypothetical protein CCACVL1_18773 [Corchorus capsularis]|uniref:Protein kinase domain-containing protein n=1 Tax=Corchorus capsularis TaxID=210143 RepID=A0A1R3HJU6_COCAP|nr:hypothetical protein CCACVL1_18773 [Corchorus capsularis]
MAMASLFRPFLLLSSFFILFPFTSPLSDSEALLNFKKSLTNAAALDSWVPGSAPCNNWNGVLCSKQAVSVLRLEGMGLSGKMDVDSLVELKNLRSFSVMNNSFTGTLPDMNRLGSLRALFLSGNQFSGEIPAEFFAKMGSLKKIWLSNNKFTGNIPFSLGELPSLFELHLENNQFSGHIPAFKHPSLKYINMSNNKLLGEIPSSLSKFKADSFSGNPDLCGEQVGAACKKKVDDGSSEEATPNAPIDPHDHSRHLNESNKKIIAAFVTLGVMLLSVVLFFAIRWRRKKKQEDANRLGRLNSAESAVEVQVSLPTRVPRPREMEAGRNKNNSSSNRSRGGSNNGRGHGNVPELVMVNDEKGVFGLPDLMKASAEVLGNGGLGSCYKAIMANKATVVAKRMREMNALGKEPFDAEVKRIGKFKHPNVLTPLAYHYRKDEKLFVYEYLPKGNLLFLLHGDHGTTSRVELDWPSRLKIVQGIARGLDYIHTELASHDVPHGNLKSSNVLLGPDNHPFLLDYGFWPLLNPEGAKTLFAYKTPEAIQHGIVSHKSDIFCLGIIILEILTGKFPSQYLNDGNGGTDLVQWVAYGFSQGTQAEFLDPEIARRENSLGNMDKLLHIGLLCTQSDPEQRLDMKEALRMIEEVQVEGGLESQSQVRTIEVLPSLPDGYADGTPNINSQSTNSRYGNNNGEQIHESEISEDRSGRPDGVP